MLFIDNIEENANQEYISNKFEMGSTNVWGVIVSKISNFVFNFNMTKYKFDDFLQILSILNKYVFRFILFLTFFCYYVGFFLMKS